jgi:hypothetical protein
MNMHIWSKTLLVLLAFFNCIFYAQAQWRIERKIIIEDGQFYFFTVDDETQLATLYSGLVSQKLKGAKKRLFPIGREYTEPFNPLAFDINADEFVGVNWILNSMNGRYDAIKKISIKDWSKGRADWTNEDWGQASFDMPVAAPNDPWERMLEVNNTLENCFFDIIQSNTLVMGVCNQGQLWIKEYKGNIWKNRAEIKVPFKQCFTLINRPNGKIGLLDAHANYYQIDEQKNELSLIQKGNYVKAQIVIVDKDKKENYLIANEAIEAGIYNSLDQVIKESAIKLH